MPVLLHCKPIHALTCSKRSPPPVLPRTRCAPHQRSRHTSQPQASNDQPPASRPEAGAAAARSGGSVLEEGRDPKEGTKVSTNEKDQQLERRKRPAGYTPFEYITFGESRLTHELTIEVDASVEDVFWVWREQANYGEWFDIVGETILHKDDSRLTSYFYYYQWGHLPAVELYTTLCKTDMVENESIHEESVDGMPLATAVYFEETESQTTQVFLRLAYLLPDNLRQYVGPVGVWGDINDILMEGLQTMKEQVESGTAIYMLEEELGEETDFLQELEVDTDSDGGADDLQEE